MSIQRRDWLKAGALGTLSAMGALPGQNAWAQAAWKPNDRISYVLGVAPGGSVDIYARGVQEIGRAHV